MENQRTTGTHRSEITAFVGLLFASFIVNILAIQIIILGFYSLIILVYFNSRKDSFWILFFLCVTNNLGGMYGLEQELFSFGLFSLSLVEGVSFAAIIKIINRRVKRGVYYQKPFLVFILYSGLLVILGFIYGMSFGQTGFGLLYPLLRNVFLLPLFLTIPRLLWDPEILHNLFRLLFAAVVINLLGQAYTLLTGNQLHTLTSGRIIPDVWTIRPIYGYYCVFIALFLGFYFLLKPGRGFSFGFAAAIILLSALSIFITATRGWIVSVLFILVAITITTPRLLKRFPLILLGLGIGVFFITQSSPVLERQLEYGMQRLSTIEELVRGDLTAGGTMRRLTDRSPRVIKEFYEKPVFGWGYSTHGLNYHDYHVGNQSILMTGGILGLGIVLYWIFFMVNRPFRLFKTLKRTGRPVPQLKIIPIFLIGLFIIHSSSTQLFGYMPYFYPIHFNKVLFLALILSLFNIIYLRNRDNCQHIQNQNP